MLTLLPVLLASSTTGFPGLEFQEASFQADVESSFQRFGLNITDSWALRLTPLQLIIPRQMA